MIKGCQVTHCDLVASINIECFEIAVRKNKNDDNFYLLMSLSYLNNGDKEAAERWMKKAEEVADVDADKKRYHRKLDMLMSSGTGS